MEFPGSVMATQDPYWRREFSFFTESSIVFVSVGTHLCSVLFGIFPLSFWSVDCDPVGTPIHKYTQSDSR